MNFCVINVTEINQSINTLGIAKWKEKKKKKTYLETKKLNSVIEYIKVMHIIFKKITSNGNGIFFFICKMAISLIFSSTIQLKMWTMQTHSHSKRFVGQQKHKHRTYIKNVCSIWFSRKICTYYLYCPLAIFIISNVVAFIFS